MKAGVVSAMPMTRPATMSGRGSFATTSRSAGLVDLLGGHTHASVAMSGDEYRAMQRLYGYMDERPNMRPPAPEPPANASHDNLREYKFAKERHANWKDPRPFMQAGADVNLYRHAEADGLRLLAWIAKFIQPGDDPLKTLVQLAVGAGWDVDPEDAEWCDDEPVSAGRGET